MKEFKYIWLVGLLVTAFIIITPVALLVSGNETPTDDPWVYVQPTPAHTDHASLLTGPYETGPDVTVACLECHETAAAQIMGTTHWTWESEPVLLPGRDEPVTVGKKNRIYTGVRSGMRRSPSNKEPNASQTLRPCLRIVEM